MTHSKAHRATPTIKQIADGAPFDATLTIRQLCQYLVDHGNPLGAFATPEDKLPDIPAPALADLPPRLVELLAHHGYVGPDQIRTATDDELLAIDGIANKTLSLIRSTLTT